MSLLLPVESVILRLSFTIPLADGLTSRSRGIGGLFEMVEPASCTFPGVVFRSLENSGTSGSIVALVLYPIVDLLRVK